MAGDLCRSDAGQQYLCRRSRKRSQKAPKFSRQVDPSQLLPQSLRLSGFSNFRVFSVCLHSLTIGSRLLIKCRVIIAGMCSMVWVKMKKMMPMVKVVQSTMILREIFMCSSSLLLKCEIWASRSFNLQSSVTAFPFIGWPRF